MTIDNQTRRPDEYAQDIVARALVENTVKQLREGVNVYRPTFQLIGAHVKLIKGDVFVVTDNKAW